MSLFQLSGHMRDVNKIIIINSGNDVMSFSQQSQFMCRRVMIIDYSRAECVLHIGAAFNYRLRRPCSASSSWEPPHAHFGKVHFRKQINSNFHTVSLHLIKRSSRKGRNIFRNDFNLSPDVR